MAINLYFDKKLNTSTNNVAKLGQRISIHTGNIPKYIETLKLYTLKNTKMESNKYPIIEIENIIKINFFLFSEVIKLKNKNIKPHTKPGRKLWYLTSPKIHIR